MIKITKDVDVEAVFLHPDEPALEFEGFLKKQYPRVRYFQVIIYILSIRYIVYIYLIDIPYFYYHQNCNNWIIMKVCSQFNHLQGSLMEGDDLDRVQADNADAVLILTNKYCQVDCQYCILSYFHTFTHPWVHTFKLLKFDALILSRLPTNMIGGFTFMYENFL